MKKICKTMAAVLSAALLINSMFAVSTMKVYAEPAEENMTENEGTPEVPGTTDMEGDTLPDEDLLTDEEIAQLLAGDGAVSVFATRSANTLGKFSMTFKDGNLEYTKVIYAIDYPQEGEDWVWKDYTGGLVDAVRVIIIPKGVYPIAVVGGSVTALGMDPEGNPPTNNIEDYNLCGTIEDGGGLWLIPGCTYEFTELEIEELKPAKLNVESYDNTHGKIMYESADGFECEVSANGIENEPANKVWWEPAEPKYSLNFDNLSVSVKYDDTDDTEAKREFVDKFTGASKSYNAAELWPNMAYSLSGIEFVEGLATFRWSYGENIPGHEDEYVGNGKIEITGAKYAGNSVVNSGNHDDQVYWINDTTFQEGNNVWQGGEGAFLPGTVVTITLIPDRGYQLTEFTINEQPNSTKAEGTISTFTFTVPNANFHLGAKFTPMADEVDSKVSGIAGGTLNIAQNEYANGTAALTVNNTSVSAEEESAFVANAQQAGFEVAKYVDLKLENRFYKGNTTDFWTTTEDKSNLNSPATISLSLSDITADDFEIVHQKHDGTYEVLDATYSNGNVTFSTNSFSKFAIVAKGMKTSSTPESGSTTPSSSSSSSDDSDDEDTASTVTTENNTSLGTVVGGSVVKDWDGLEKILENKTLTGNKTTDGNTTAAPIVLTLNQMNSTVPVSTLRALEASESVGLHLMMGNGVAITIANGAGLKNQPAINLSSKVETTRNSKTISFASNTKLNTLVALHMSVPKNVKEVKLYYYINGHAYFLGTLTTINGQVMFPISQLGIYKLVY